MFRLLSLVLLGSLSTVAAQGISVVNEQNFDQEIQSGIVVVDFYAAWCGPCKQLNVVLDNLSKNMKEGTKIIKVNIDKSKGLMDKYNVSSVPTLIIFKDGKEMSRLAGYNDQKTIERLIDAAK